jgi:hypothetical protein
MGGLLGHAVRFGAADDVLAVGEGIETMLSLRYALPVMSMTAALSATTSPRFCSRRHCDGSLTNGRRERSVVFKRIGIGLPGALIRH